MDSPTPSTHRKGRFFEELAARHLREAGLRILARNVRLGRNEIDLIVRDGHVVAFVEVKGRLHRGTGHPFEAITHRKRRELSRAARRWIRAHGEPDRLYRFDAVAVLPGAEGWIIEYLPDAWRESHG